MTERRQYVLVCLAVFAVALAARTVTLYWSPLPATLDGFDYAALARDTIVNTHFPLGRIRADNFGFTGLLAAVSLLVDVPPLRMAQPVVAIVGAGSCLTAVALARRLGWAIGLSSRRARLGAVLAGLTLAVEGLYLRRTGVADEEALGLLLVPLFAIALLRALRTRRAGWIGLSLVFVLAFPLIHTFSTLIAAITALALVATQVLRVPTRRLGLLGAVLVGGFWAYFGLYYEVAARVGLTVPYVDRVLSFPGLFVGWLIVLVLGILWIRQASPRLQTGALLAVVGSGYLVVIANFFLPVFPGTVSTPRLVLALVALFVVPVLFASRGLPLATRSSSTGAIVLALLAAPIAQVYFSLTASLTPEFFGTVMRAQTFVHVPIFVLAAIAVVRYLPEATATTPSIVPTRRRTVSLLLIGALVVSAVLTVPLAFIDLDTASYPSTTTQSEFAAATFTATHTTQRWATADPLARIGSLYYGTSASQVPVSNWLTGGTSPLCPTLSRHAWTTTGAHLFPAAPETISESRYERWLAQRNLVYSAGARDTLSLTLPSTETASGC